VNVTIEGIPSVGLYGELITEIDLRIFRAIPGSKPGELERPQFFIGFAVLLFIYSNTGSGSKKSKKIKTVVVQ
jgi:hypothetical protein